MEKLMADAFLDFYKKMLKPEFDVLKGKQVEHDERFSEVLGHLDSIYNRIVRLEDDSLTINTRLKLIEDAIESGNAKRAELEGIVGKIQKSLPQKK